VFARKRQWYRLVAGGCVLATATTFAACGGDDDDDSTASDATTAGSGDLSAACGAYTEVNDAVNALFENETPEDVKATYSEAGVDDILDRLAENAPNEIADEIDEGVTAVRSVGESGDPSALEEFDPTLIDAFFFENCDFEQVDVTAKDYEFDGFPGELAAGTASFKFTNDGADAHEMVIVRRNEGTTETVEELLALPEEESEKKVTFVTATGAEPGDTAYVTGELETGEYIAICFVPQGTTSQEEEGTGPPHAMLGMTKEFTVS
jgi:hypothetical protein